MLHSSINYPRLAAQVAQVTTVVAVAVGVGVAVMPCIMVTAVKLVRGVGGKITTPNMETRVVTSRGMLERRVRGGMVRNR